VTFNLEEKQMKRIFNGAQLALLTVFVCSVPVISHAAPIVPCRADIDCVLAGNDYFVTQPGTFFVIGGVNVPLMGVPDPANFGADTVVQRLANIDLSDTVIGGTETVNTQMLELRLTGLDPSCPATGTPCNVTIGLDPAHPTLGNLVFTQTTTVEGGIEGTFTSFFDVFFDLSFTTLGGAPLPCDVNGDTVCLQPDLTLTANGQWTDDNGALFIAGAKVTESHPGSGVHVAQQMMTPEPVSSILFVTGLAGLITLARRRQLRG
jgi:hypothetical protein